MIFDKIAEYYVDKCIWAIERCNATRVLKTDASNEARTDWPGPGGILARLPVRATAVEIDTDVIAAAYRAFPNADYVHGDIRSLPFADHSFDLILDLSTLDHIPQSDVAACIAEYRRVAPDLLVVAWYTDDRNVLATSNAQSWTGKEQYEFNRQAVLSILQRHYKTIDSDEAFFAEQNHYLSCDLCRRAT